MTQFFLKLNTHLTRSFMRLILIVWVVLCVHQPSESFAKEKKEKVIDFEDSLVEGMNKKPLDSLSQISEAERRRRRSHLYRKRAGFSTETYETIRTLRNVQ